MYATCKSSNRKEKARERYAGLGRRDRARWCITHWMTSGLQGKKNLLLPLTPGACVCVRARACACAHMHMHTHVWVCVWALPGECPSHSARVSGEWEISCLIVHIFNLCIHVSTHVYKATFLKREFLCAHKCPKWHVHK